MLATVSGETVRRALKQSSRAGWVQARKALLRLQDFDLDALLFPMDGAKHLGDPQHRVDAAVLDAVESELRRWIPDIRVVGEESLRTLRPNNYMVAVVDPVDGTKPFIHTGCAWAIAIVLLEFRPGRNTLFVRAVSVLTSSGILAIVMDEDLTTIQLIEDDVDDTLTTIVECSPRQEGRSLAVACVSAKPADRRALLERVGDLGDTVIFNIGGNPVFPGVLTGDLDGIISLKRQTMWDAAYAFLISRGGGVVGGVDEYRVLDKAEIADWFRKPIQGGSNEEVKPVVPIIAAKDEQAYGEIFAWLAGRKGAYSSLIRGR